MLLIETRHALLLTAVAGVLGMPAAAIAQINSYGSGLQPSETLSTPPNRRQGGYWNSTSQNRQHQQGRQNRSRTTARTGQSPQ